MFQKVIYYAPPLVSVYFDGILIHVVQEIKVEVRDAAFLKLFLKSSRRVIVFGNHMTWIFGGKIITFSGVFRENFSYDALGHPSVIGICSIEIVYSIF